MAKPARTKQKPYRKADHAAPPPAPVRDPAAAAQMRLAAIVIIAAALLWVVGNILGQELHWPARYAFLLDFAAIAAFAWGLIVTWRAWRSQAN